MKRRTFLLALLVPLALAGCDQKQAVQIPQPHRMTAEDIGHYCGMNVLEHPGPKGHIFAASLMEPVWFSSVRDTLAFTQLPDEPKDILAIYVSDMGKAPSWDKPGPDNWVEARKALFVIESRVTSGMGGNEAVPFSERAAAEKFVAENGGRIVGFGEVPRDYVLASANLRSGAASDEATEVSPGERSKRMP
ncbi:nitrous oxide reductase accessory protein NosL [Bradyrhizobium iriomotense]|uniref:nitrous oxide reductase accessory protein NosL n=1 Tax=Bradyrhizobium iriomotense TaxID=441950 RepID=UPI001B8A22E2|nr:nitrous oxide reductase accessory protein NosL [Bradyrhizobium iriomotense]MBR0779882.1 nitrous oxide reductase accessory protein NosL [Bradyrhizobium iriomotense]